MCTVNDCYLCEVGYGFEVNGERSFHRGDYIPYRAVNIFVKGRKGYSTFCTAYRYDTDNLSRANLYGDMYLDLDDEDDFEHVREDARSVFSYFKIVYRIPPEQMHIFFSGKKGIHIIIPADILGVEPMPMLNGVYKSIANSVRTYTPHKTIDLKIYDNKRLFRIPNTIHEKTNLYKIPITLDELNTMSIEDIRKMAQSQRHLDFTKANAVNNTARQAFQKAIEEYAVLDKETRKDRRFKTTMNFVPPCIQKILEDGAEVGQRNITIACLTGFYKAYGKSLNETTDLILEWNSKNTRPTGATELKRTVQSMFNGQKMFGCSTLKTITVCDPAHCKLSKKGDINHVTDSKNQETQRQRQAPYKR